MLFNSWLACFKSCSRFLTSSSFFLINILFISFDMTFLLASYLPFDILLFSVRVLALKYLYLICFSSFSFFSASGFLNVNCAGLSESYQCIGCDKLRLKVWQRPYTKVLFALSTFWSKTREIKNRSLEIWIAMGWMSTPYIQFSIR